MSDKNKEDSTLKKMAKAVADVTAATIITSLPPEEQEELLGVGINYALRSRRLPHLSEACLAYMSQSEALQNKEEGSIVYYDD